MQEEPVLLNGEVTTATLAIAKQSLLSVCPHFCLRAACVWGRTLLLPWAGWKEQQYAVHVTGAGELFIPDQSRATITPSEQRAWLYFSCVSGDILAGSVSLAVFIAEMRARQPSDKLSE